MDTQLSDEQIDRIAKNLLEDFALSGEALDEIAGAPQLWWNVRNQIEAENARCEKTRFRWFRAPVLAFGALAVLIGGAAFLFLSFANNPSSTVALETPVENPARQIAEAPENSPATVAPKVEIEKAEISKSRTPEKNSLKRVAPPVRFAAQKQGDENSAKPVNRSSKKETSLETAAVAETKTDFIALSYAANTESGQIVRVKVPSLMMVTLGVKTEVENSAELVNAEVVIGDDGLARAIRFIR